MISVIIPTKNRPADLLACLDGVARQDARELLSQVIVVDDHSQQRHRLAVERFGHERALPLVYIDDLPEHGAAAARNHGAAAASGDILAFLDDDAVPARTWLSVIEQRLGTPGITAITGRILPLDGERLFSRARQLRYELRQRRAIAHSEEITFLAGGNSALWRCDFEQVGGFDPDLALMHDRDLVMRLRRHGKRCLYVHELLIHHRHFKGLSLALGQSFHAARYRLLLEARHPRMKTWSLDGLLDNIEEYANVSWREPRWAGPSMAAVLTEMIHGVGYHWYRRRLRAQPRPDSPVFM